MVLGLYVTYSTDSLSGSLATVTWNRPNTLLCRKVCFFPNFSFSLGGQASEILHSSKKLLPVKCSCFKSLYTCWQSHAIVAPSVKELQQKVFVSWILFFPPHERKKFLSIWKSKSHRTTSSEEHIASNDNYCERRSVGITRTVV